MTRPYRCWAKAAMGGAIRWRAGQGDDVEREGRVDAKVWGRARPGKGGVVCEGVRVGVEPSLVLTGSFVVVRVVKWGCIMSAYQRGKGVVVDGCWTAGESLGGASAG